MAIAVLVGTWAYLDAQNNAAERFDRSLLSTALAISRDIAVSGGDALSRDTRDLLRDTSNGSVFYHVYAPDGVFVTGYATPPVPPSTPQPNSAQTFYDAVYQGAPVRALRVVQNTSIDGLAGPFTFTVWQNTDVRDGFVQSRTQPVFLIIASMIGALGIVVWFGVAVGLSPLTDLEDAIARRSSDDLSPIKRRIPPETQGVVGRFNDLLGELSQTMDEKDAFISDAAHQLRNPIAGVLTLADSVDRSQTLESAKARARDLIVAAREAGHLTDNLLKLERMRAGIDSNKRVFDPFKMLAEVDRSFRAKIVVPSLRYSAELRAGPAQLNGNPTMFQEAVKNLLDNALMHGGDDLTHVRLNASVASGKLVVEVQDDGTGIAPANFQNALGRFSQIGPSAGSGLGLPIAKAVTEDFGGTLHLQKTDALFSVMMEFPLASHI
ncbi:MAG: sensor histidine kinase [Pseudomonadota bacterium]